MADVAVDVKETKVATPEKEVEKKVAEASPVKEAKVAENGNSKVDEDKPKENGATEENGAGDESKEKENGDSTDSVESAPVKRKSEKGDALEKATADGVSPEKKAKLDTVDNGSEEKVAEATA